jgi:transcriptional regulator with XRE-family HTH domain
MLDPVPNVTLFANSEIRLYFSHMMNCGPFRAWPELELRKRCISREGSSLATTHVSRPVQYNTLLSIHTLRMAVSIKDIARLAGVSHSTVSRALHNSPLIPPETARRIQQIAKEAGYTASAIARSLVTQRTQAIGVVVTSIADPFNGEIVAVCPFSVRLPVC